MSLNFKMPLSQAPSRFSHRQIIAEGGQEEPGAQYGNRLTSPGVSPPQISAFYLFAFCHAAAVDPGWNVPQRRPIRID